MNKGILARMAKLRDEAWVVKRLYRFFAETGYSRGNSTYTYRIGHITTGVPEGDFLLSLQTRMRFRDWFVSLFRPLHFKSPKYQLQRMDKIDWLYKECRKDGYIEPVIGTNGNETGIKVSSLGGDLIHWAGFVEILLKKYPTPKLILYSVISTLLSTAVLGVIIIKVLEWWHV